MPSSQLNPLYVIYYVLQNVRHVGLVVMLPFGEARRQCGPHVRITPLQFFCPLLESHLISTDISHPFSSISSTFHENISSTNSFLEVSALTSMKRTWTKESTREWCNRRDEFREHRGLISMEQLKSSKDKKGRGTYEDIMKLERDTILERLRKYSQETVSWQVSILVLLTASATIQETEACYSPLILAYMAGICRIGAEVSFCAFSSTIRRCPAPSAPLQSE